MSHSKDNSRVAGEKGHHDRKDLAGEHPFGDAGQLILLVLFLLIWGLDSFVFKFSTFLNPGVPDYVRIPLHGIGGLHGKASLSSAPDLAGSEAAVNPV